MKLALLLEEENALLAAADYARIGDRVDDKRLLLADLEASRALPDAPDTDSDRTLASRLDSLANENRTALERALVVQDQIMGILADAARHMNESSGYGSGGKRPLSNANHAFALIVRA